MYKVISWERASRIVTLNPERDFLFLSGTPNEEPCTPAGRDFDSQIKECTAYINQLQRIYGPPPEGAEFSIIENHHEFGTYYEAGIWFTENVWETQEDSTSEDIEYEEPASQVYAMQCEIGPDKWDDEAIEELRQSGHPAYQPAKVIPIRKAI